MHFSPPLPPAIPPDSLRANNDWKPFTPQAICLQQFGTNCKGLLRCLSGANGSQRRVNCTTSFRRNVGSPAIAVKTRLLRRWCPEPPISFAIPLIAYYGYTRLTVTTDT